MPTAPQLGGMWGSSVPGLWVPESTCSGKGAERQFYGVLQGEIKRKEGRKGRRKRGKEKRREEGRKGSEGR